MKLTKNFLYGEIFRPETSGNVSVYDVYKARVLLTLVLQPVRDRYGPVYVTSGKRSRAHNRRVGGVRTSDHLFSGPSAAVDFSCGNNAAAYQWIAVNCRDLLGQLIAYIDLDETTRFIHVSLGTPKHTAELLTATYDPPRVYSAYIG